MFVYNSASKSATVCVILQLAGLAKDLDPKKIKTKDLYEYVSTSPFFKEANPASYLEDITDDA